MTSCTEWVYSRGDFTGYFCGRPAEGDPFAPELCKMHLRHAQRRVQKDAERNEEMSAAAKQREEANERANRIADLLGIRVQIQTDRGRSLAHYPTGNIIMRLDDLEALVMRIK